MTINKQADFSENKSHTTFLYGNTEYNKPSQNNNNIIKLNRRSSMNQNEYNYLELKQNNMHIILEFPKEPEKEENIKREVKGILSNILQEHITNIS